MQQEQSALANTPSFHGPQFIAASKGSGVGASHPTGALHAHLRFLWLFREIVLHVTDETHGSALLTNKQSVQHAALLQADGEGSALYPSSAAVSLHVLLQCQRWQRAGKSHPPVLLCTHSQPGNFFFHISLIFNCISPVHIHTWLFVSTFSKTVAFNYNLISY